jgi:hypothetical protein
VCVCVYSLLMIFLVRHKLDDFFLNVLRVFLSCSSSYLHCQWASVEDLEKDKRIQQKIKRFKSKQGQSKFLSEVWNNLISF